MRVLKIAVVLLTILTPCLVKANDIVVSTASLTGQNTSAGANNAANYTMVRFNLSWSNSWRVNSGPTNWDAAWVFVKYRIEGGTGCTAGNWQHATLSNVAGNHSITTDNGTAGMFTPSADTRGVFIHRSGNGTGAINWQQVMLRWNYGADGVLDACNVSVKVFAIEMVYVPQGAYYAGDGASDHGQFKAGTTANPLQITSEAALTLGGSAVTSLGNSNGNGETAPVDDFNNTTTQTLPADFPKGFAAFYSMKYEISQEQYVEFLNTQTAPQQLLRHPATASGRFWSNSATPTVRNGVKCVTLPVGSTAGTYACDLNANGTNNETTDGQNIAMVGTTAMDLMAYLDWSGLRLMTELELEKAGRGTLPAVNGEFAWGSANIYATSYTPLSNSGAGNELPSSPSTTLGNSLYQSTAGALGGPMRVGSFATASSSRVTAGASYYGIMDITGNVWEVVVGVAFVAGRSYTGVHGNGSLSTAGHADVNYWPGSNGNATSTSAQTIPNNGSTAAVGTMFRCGSWQNTAFMRLSDRTYPGWVDMNTRDGRMGGRGVRTAP
ncbi:MAG TPA: SUMF1/EgtB/PvdO family nonheme iron enzyme [Cyclobacteriaceae bacterium]|nr:SUMF1/EgtB/PvdO family nonheme iron enzyme [Cyclobacteriaceae bacterium]